MRLNGAGLGTDKIAHIFQQRAIYNPSVYVSLFGFRAAVRKIVSKQACPQRRKLYPDLSGADFEKLTADLKLCHGEDYGFKTSSDLVTIADACY